MDAAHTLFKKTSLFFALALFVTAGGLKAQPSFLSPVNNATYTLTTGGLTVPVTGSADGTGANPIAYRATLSNFQTPGGGTFQWVSLSGGGTGTTPSNLQFSSPTLGTIQGTYTATVTVTPTGASATAGVAGLTFTLQFVSSGGGGGGGGNGTITATPTNLPLVTTTGNVTTGTVTLSTTSTTPIPFTISFSNSSWLSAGSTSTSVVNGSNAVLTVVGNAFNITSNQTGTITVTPTSGTPTIITVTLNVGSGGGTTGLITASPNPVTWTYTSGSGIFPSQSVNLQTSTTATTYSATVTNGNWLLVNGGTTGVGGTISTGGLTLTAGNAITTLATGVYTGTVALTDPLGGQGTLTVNLTVNGGTTAGLSLSPSAGLMFTGAVGSGITGTQTIAITSGVAGTLAVNCTSSGWLSCTSIPGNIAANSPTNVTVFANAAGLTNLTYNGQFSVTVTPSSGTPLSGSVPVSFVVGTGGSGGGGGVTGFAVGPASLVFTYQTGSPRGSVAQQTLGITGPPGQSWSGTTSTTSGGGWLNLRTVLANFQQDGTSSTTISIDPNGLTNPTYTGTVTITSAGLTQSVAVTLNIVAAPILLPTPGSALFNFHTGDPALQPVTIGVTASDGSLVTATATTTTSWLTVTQTSGATSFSITANPASMASGLYTGAVTVTQAGMANSPLTVPVVLLINGGTGTGGGSGTLTLSPASLIFNAIVNAASPPAQNLLVSASSTTNFTATAATASGGTWLVLGQSGGVAGPTGTNIGVFVTSTGLALGTYNGTISLTTTGGTQTVPVVLNVTTTGTSGGNVTADKSSLVFAGQSGAANPPAQTLNISSTSGSAGVSVTATANTSSGGTWLSVTPSSGTTPLPLTVTASVSGLGAGTYNGTITVTPTGGGASLSIPVSVSVSTVPTVSASPTSLTFSYRAGDTPPSTQTISVSGAGSSLPFTASASSTGNWLIVSPASGTTPATVTVSISPAGLNASPTPYIGTITVSGSGTATGTTAITVSLTVTAPLPTVSKLTNAGSFQNATAIAPGEIITLFASDAQHPIGPATAVGLTLDAGGKVATSIGGVQVLAAGFPCPMIFASATQVSAVVPYELAGFVFSGADVLVRFLGQTSNAIHVNVSTTAPGLFTANSSGTGPGAILNSNNSVNSPGNPAARGDTVVVYLTGEGQTTPTGVTGKVTTVSPTGPLTPTPLLPIAILIGPAGAQQAANYTFAGEAPGFVSGAMQLNVQIPLTVSTGDQPIVVSIGPNSSQPGVTVSIK